MRNEQKNLLHIQNWIKNTYPLGRRTLPRGYKDPNTNRKNSQPNKWTQKYVRKYKSPYPIFKQNIKYNEDD